MLVALATVVGEPFGNFKVRDLVNTAWAHAAVAQSDAPLLVVLARAAKRCLGDFDPQGIANIAWAFATMRQLHELLLAA